jgi:hypothetical protein
LHGHNEVFQTALFLLFLRRLAMHHAVKASRVLEEIVHTSHDAKHPEGEEVNSDDRDDTAN